MPPMSMSSSSAGSKGDGPAICRPARGAARSSRCKARGKYPLALAQPAELEAGAQGFHVAGLRGTLAGGRFAVDELRWQDGRLSSRGEFAALPAAPLLAFTGAATRLSSTLTLAGRWSFAATPRITGSLSVSREGGDLAPVDAPDLALGLTRAELTAEFVDDRVHATLDRALAPGRRRHERRSRAVARIGGRFGADSPLRLSARVDATSLRALQGVAGTTAIVDGRLKLDLAGTRHAGPRAFYRHRRRRCAQGRSGAVRRCAEGWSLARAAVGRMSVNVSEFSFAAGEGRFVASGTLPASRDIEGARLAWKADKLALFNRPDSKLTLTGAGTLSFQRGSVTVAGALKADEGYFEFRPERNRRARRRRDRARTRKAARRARSRSACRSTSTSISISATS